MTHGPAAAIGHIRLWSLNWIRAYAMLLGIPVHAGYIYSSGYDWFVSSPEKSGVITAITGILTSTRMPLFFFVAGLLSAINLSRRPARAWVLHRVERLGVILSPRHSSSAPWSYWRWPASSPDSLAKRAAIGKG